MKTILKQIKNEWNSNLFLFVELLLVFVVLWYIVDWTLVTARVYHAPMGFDTEHCYNITVSKLGEDSPLYNPELTADDDMDDLLRLTDRLRHCPGVEAVAISQNCFPYNEGSNSIDLGIDSVAVNVRLLWVEADFFRVFRYAFTEEAEFAKVEAAFRNDEPVVSSNLTEGHPELGGSASLPGREVLLLNYGKDVRRRIGAVGTPCAGRISILRRSGAGLLQPFRSMRRGYGISVIPVMSQSACAFPKMPIRTLPKS